MRKVVLITGASRGIGFSIAKALESSFENLILVAKHKENLDKAVSNLTKSKTVVIPTSLEDEKEILRLVKQVKQKFDSLDVLINDAGAYIGKRFEKITPKEISQLINLNFKSYYLLTQQLLPLLKKGNNPQIINISSCAAHANIYGESLYSATKAAVTSFSDVIRKELNKDKIRVTIVQPWGVDTYETPQPDLLNPDEIGKLINYIVNVPPNTQIDLVEISNIKQWRGEKPSWIK